METKLTLSMDKEVIEKAKAFAKKNHTSLSRLIEDYFSALTGQSKRNNAKDKDISPLVKSLSGVLQLPDNYDFKKDRLQYLDKKHK